MPFESCSDFGIEFTFIDFIFLIANFRNKAAETLNRAVFCASESTVTSRVYLCRATIDMSAFFMNCNNGTLACNPGNLAFGNRTALVNNSIKMNSVSLKIFNGNYNTVATSLFII